MSSPPNASSLLPFCTDIEDILRGGPPLIVLHVHLSILGATLLAIALLLFQFHQNRIAVHGNLLFLFAKIIFLYFVHTFAWFSCFFRYRILTLLYTDPCQLLTPIWLVFCLYGPYYMYSLAYPAFHFCVMIERLRATILAEKYEQEGQKLGLKMALGIWTLSLAYLTFVIWTCLLDHQNFGHPQGVIFMTSAYNAQIILYLNFFLLILIIFTAFADWRITRMNRRIRLKKDSCQLAIGYSLSRNYQLNENSLTMQLILPLDIFYAVFYALHIGSVIVIRSYRPWLSNRDYVFYYYLADTFLFLHTFVTLIVYIRFLKFIRQNQQRNMDVKPKGEHAKIYFNQLRAQWE